MYHVVLLRKTWKKPPLPLLSPTHRTTSPRVNLTITTGSSPPPSLIQLREFESSKKSMAQHKAVAEGAQRRLEKVAGKVGGVHGKRRRVRVKGKE
jgi:hypothetical protein